MKQKFKKVMVVLLSFALSLSTCQFFSKKASAATVGDWSYDVIYTNEGVSITGYSGDASELKIPAELDGQKVTAIVGEAFSRNKNLTRVEIPEGITSIGAAAFAQCENLTNVEIPASVINIGMEAFYMCENLLSIKIPKGVAIIRDETFAECPKLKSVELPDTLTEIKTSAFSGCKSLEKIEIPESVKSIENSAFSGSGITSVNIPKSVTSLGYSGNPFSGCANLEKIQVDPGNAKYDSRDACNGIIETRNNSLIIACKKTVIPASVIKIGDYAYLGSSITRIKIPDNIIKIGDSAFAGCDDLVEIEIPKSVTRIESWAFENCDSLKDVYYTGSEEEWNNIYIDGAWSNSSLLSANIHYNARMESEDESPAISTEDQGKTSSSTPIIGQVFSDAKGSGSYRFLSADQVSYESPSNKDIKKTVIPAAITEDGHTYKVTAISNNAFSGCTKLQNVTIGKNVTNIGNNAFSNCKTLKKIVIPINIKKIGKKAFYGCKNLKKITIKTKKLTNKSVGAQAFKGIHKKVVISVPKKQKKAYKKWLKKKGITKKAKIK